MNNQSNTPDDAVATIDNEKVQLIMRQTTLTNEDAIAKLILFNHDEVAVIRDFLGLEQPVKNAPVTSINQEIYKCIRTKMDTSMRDYNNKTYAKFYQS